MSWAVRLLGALLSGLCLGASLLYVQALAGREIVPDGGLFGWTKLETLCAIEQAECSPGNLTSLTSRAPLEARPFNVNLAAAFEAGDDSRIRDLAKPAFRRDPRNELARLALASEALDKGERDEFLKIYVPVFRTDSANTRAYAKSLAELTTDPQLLADVRKHILAERPPWGSAFLVEASAQHPLTDLIDLYAQYPDVQPELISRLVKEGALNQAYAVFVELLSSGALKNEAATPPLSAPYNPRFLPTAAPPPFNWHFEGSGGELKKDGGAYVFFEGRRSERFLRQEFPISPGRYRFDVRMSGTVSEAGGWFRWQFGCADSNDLIASFDVQELSSAPETLSFDFVMPRQRCRFVSLSLTGAPGVFPKPARIEIESVELLATELEPGDQ